MGTVDAVLLSHDQHGDNLDPAGRALLSQATRTLSREQETSEIPILIVTTKSMETDRVWGLRQGAKDFMVKPVAEQDLLGRINKLLS